VVTERFDILAWNAAYAALFPPPEDTGPAGDGLAGTGRAGTGLAGTGLAGTGRPGRNSLLYCFTKPACCTAFENGAEQRAAMVAQLRAAYGRHVGDPAWTGFIRTLEAASPEFAAMWATQDVAQPASYAKVFRHPLFPRLDMTSTSLAVQAAPGTRLVVYVPADDGTRRAMEQLVALGPEQPRFPCWPAHQARALVPQPG
jgi:hypothetical protein